MPQHPYRPGVADVPLAAPPVGKLLVCVPDVTLTASVPQRVADLAMYRRAIFVANRNTTAFEVRVGDRTVRADVGLPLGPGQVLTLITADEVWCFSTGAAVVSITEARE